MGELVNFPAKKRSDKTQIPFSDHSQDHLAAVTNGSQWVFSEEDDEAFLQLLKEWPCFQDLVAPPTLSDLLRFYYEDRLTLPQDCALEFMLHMHNASTIFDIGYSLYTWDEEDRRFFLLNISMHAELIASLKQEED
ncbi:MAG: hypothetical protein H6618_05595 [Deltaproteobacteria bacterium]|nr:hypothetical protein [Deltaproteobacteria bacterium]